MKTGILYFLRLFLILTLTYGGSQFLILYFFGDSQNLLRSLISGLGFGLFMSLFFAISQARAVKKLTKESLTDDTLNLHQTAHFQSPLSKEEIITRLQNHYPSKDWEMQEMDSLIKLKTTFTAKTFGEKITLKVTQLQNGFSDVLVESKPKTWFTLVDYGKNLQNIHYLKNLLAA